MRTIPYRDVLWGIAYKQGLDPAKDLHGDQADALDSYINASVRRFYDAADFPEWTNVEDFAPDANHIVPYGTRDEHIGRTFKLYLNDPVTTPGPLEYPYRLTARGIHCGFEHGTRVWIKSILAPPQYSSRPWDGDVTYARGEVVYSPLNGECYVSNVHGNEGHDPTGEQGAEPRPLYTVLVQSVIPETQASPGRTQITKVIQGTDLLGEWRTQHTWEIVDEAGALIAGVGYEAAPTEAAADILTAIHALLEAHVALGAFTFTLSPVDIEMEANQFFAVRSSYVALEAPSSEPVTTGQPPTPDELVQGDDGLTVTVGISPVLPPNTVFNQINNVQFFIEEVIYVPPRAAIIAWVMSDQSAVPMAIYELRFVDVGGGFHVIEYVNDPARSSLGIQQGVMDAIAASTDPFFMAMSVSLEAGRLQLRFASFEMVSLNGQVVPAGNAWWTPVRFPLTLADAIMRGGYSETLREQGQTDKATPEEQGAGALALEAAAKMASPDFDPLTDQQQPGSRYRMETGGGK